MYGVTPQGFVPKPLGAVLASIEEGHVRNIGADVIQTAQSPLGQINGVVAGLAAEMWERIADVYASFDPAQAQGARLDQLARARGVFRAGQTDAELRQAVLNYANIRPTAGDLQAQLRGVDGVSYVRVFINETDTRDDLGLEPGTVAAAVIGGDDAEVAQVLRRYVVPGVSTVGNTRVTTIVRGKCRSIGLIRPVEVTVNVRFRVRRSVDRAGCPPPSIADIKSFLLDAWQRERQNGADFDLHAISVLAEREWEGVRGLAIQAGRDGESLLYNPTVPIGLYEIARLTDASLTMVDT